MTLEKIGEVRHPTLLVYGERSVFLGSFEYLRDHLPYCTPVLMPGGEHFSPLEQPERFVKDVRAFLHAKEPALDGG